MHSSVTKRRLQDGANGFAISYDNLEERETQELQSIYSGLCDAIVALQSLDDLGSETENDVAWKDMLELQKRCNEVEKVIDRRGEKARWV